MGPVKPSYKNSSFAGYFQNETKNVFERSERWTIYINVRHKILVHVCLYSM